MCTHTQTIIYTYTCATPEGDHLTYHVLLSSRFPFFFYMYNKATIDIRLKLIINPVHSLACMEKFHGASQRQIRLSGFQFWR